MTEIFGPSIATAKLSAFTARLEWLSRAAEPGGITACAAREATRCEDHGLGAVGRQFLREGRPRRFFVSEFDPRRVRAKARHARTKDRRRARPVRSPCRLRGCDNSGW